MDKEQIQNTVTELKDKIQKLSYQITHAEGQIQMYKHFLTNCHASMIDIYSNNLVGWQRHFHTLEQQSATLKKELSTNEQALWMAKGLGSH